MIPDAFISQLLDRVDLVDLIGRYVRLKKTGAEWSGLCPFHKEKTPSFTVSPAKQFYHCFGCGAHGTAVGFLMHQNGHTFREAVESLSQQVGLTIPDEGDGSHQESKAPVDQKAIDLLSQTSLYYKQQLKQSQFAIDYLKKRAITGQTAARFGLGYAPEGFQNLEKGIPGYGQDVFLRTGLMVTSDKGRHYDRFRHRLMFPIQDIKGQVIGFGARSLDQSDPKYLNSPETSLFSKGRELYGLFQAKQAISKAGFCWITEGYFDVISLYQAGIAHSVASLGTAVTADQLRKLLRYTSRLYFCFDGDKAGRAAADRVLHVLLELINDQRQFFFLFLPSGHDPDSFITEFGRDRFEAMQVTAIPFSNMLLQPLLRNRNMDIPEDRVALLSNSGPWLGKMDKAPLLKMAIMAELSEKTGLSVSQIENAVKKEPVFKRAPIVKARTPRPLRQISLANRLLSIILHQPNWRYNMLSRLHWQKMTDADCALLGKVVAFTGSFDEGEFIPALLAFFADPEDQRRIQQASDFRWAANLIEEELRAELDDGLGQLEHFWQQRELDRFKRLVMERPLTDVERQDMDYLLGQIVGYRAGSQENKESVIK